LDAVDEFRCSAFMYAWNHDQNEIMGILRRAGANPSTEQDGREPPASSGYVELPPDMMEALARVKALPGSTTGGAGSADAQTPTPIPVAPVQVSETPEEAEAGGYRFGALRRTLREVASRRTTALYTGLVVGMLGLAATQGISNRIDEHRSTKAAMVSQNAPEAPLKEDIWKNWTPAQEKERQANDKHLIDAARRSDHESAKRALDKGVTWEALEEARHIAALNKDWPTIHLTSWVTSSTLAPDLKGPPKLKEKTEQGQPEGKEHEDDNIRFAAAMEPTSECTARWDMGSVKLALKRTASQHALSEALWRVGNNNFGADEKKSTEVAYLIAQRMEPILESEPRTPARVEEKPKTPAPQQAKPEKPGVPHAQQVPKTPGNVAH
jgi:hypothetical protein